MDKYLELIEKQKKLIDRLESEHEKKHGQFTRRYFLNPMEFVEQAKVESAIRENEEHTKNLGIKHPFLEEFKKYFQELKKDKSTRFVVILYSLILFIIVNVLYILEMLEHNMPVNLIFGIASGICAGSAAFLGVPLLSGVLLKIEQKRYNLDELKKEHEKLTSELEPLKEKVAEWVAEKEADGLEIDKLSEEIKSAKEFLTFLINQRNHALESVTVKEAINQEFSDNQELTQELARRRVNEVNE